MAFAPSDIIFSLRDSIFPVIVSLLFEDISFRKLGIDNPPQTVNGFN